MKNTFSLFFILFVANSILGQELEEVVLKGKINANSIDLDGVYVINMRTEKSTKTIKEGFFTIAAVPGDTLLFSVNYLKEIRVVLKQENFQSIFFLVEMEAINMQLREVVIKRYVGINAVDLGISPKGIKQLTQAERRLKTATGFSPQVNSNSTMAGGTMSLDPVLNLISGRTAMLKKELEVEKKISYKSLLENMFNEGYLKNTLKIPSEYIDGFLYYAVENKKFTIVLETKNKISIEFLLVKLAEKYNAIILSDTENKE